MEKAGFFNNESGFDNIRKVPNPNPNDLAKINSDGEIENSNIQVSDVELNTNKTSVFQQTPDDIRYPTEKLVKDNLDLKVNISDIKNDLTSTDIDKPLSAKQGKLLQDTKANKVLGGKENNFLKLGANGNIVGSEIDGDNFNGANQLVKLDPTGKLAALDGSQLTNISASQPTGAYVFTIATSVAGALACNGSSYSKSTYSNLYALITAELGANALEDPLNNSNFILGEDFEGRVLGVIGSGRTLFEKAGSDTHVLTENELPSHKHIVGTKRIYDASDGEYGTVSNVGFVQNPVARYADGINTADYDLDYTSNTGGGQAHSLVQKTAYIGRLFIYY